ncbi:MAG: cysteine-rich CWC family protein [Thiomonas sp.]
MTAAPRDPARCPLCGKPNGCAMARGGGADASCWCTKVRIAPQTLARIPADLRGAACLCLRCATAQTAAPGSRP